MDPIQTNAWQVSQTVPAQDLPRSPPQPLPSCTSIKNNANHFLCQDFHRVQAWRGVWGDVHSASLAGHVMGIGNQYFPSAKDLAI
jgi:hypothetical protein